MGGNPRAWRGVVGSKQLTALSYGGLQDRLRGQGAIIQDLGTKGHLFREWLLAGTEHNLRINGDGMVVFEYHTTLGAFYDTTRFSADGKTLQPSVTPGALAPGPWPAGPQFAGA